MDSIPLGSSVLGTAERSDSMTTGDGGQNPFLQYFGPPTGPIATNPYDKFGYTNYDLPEAYRGRNMYLRDTIDGFIMDDNTWYTSACLPYVKTDEHHFVWNEWHFDTHLVGRVPEEGISRLIRSSKRSFKESTVRRGIAFQLEHGFMNTPDGRDQYVMNLRQIQQSVQETANHDVIAALLTCRRYDREWEKKHGVYSKDFAQLMKREVNQWAIAQKNPNGLDYMHEEFKGRLNRWKVTPNMWIFPPKLCLYLSMVPPEKTKFMEVGPEGPAKFNAGAQALTSFRGVHVYETREFDVYEGDLPIDLLRRKRQIGEYNVMTDPYRHATDGDVVKDYKSEHRDVVVYDEDHDRWARVSFSDALGACKDRPSNKSQSPVKGDLYYNDETDQRVNFFGEISKDHLTDKDIIRVAKSIHAKFGDDSKIKVAQIQSLVSEYGRGGEVTMFRRETGGSGLSVEEVVATVVDTGTDTSGTFVNDLVSRLDDVGDQQRFLHGLKNTLLDKANLKNNKNLYKAMMKKAPKEATKISTWLAKSPFWDFELDVSRSVQGEKWVATTETWNPKYANDPNWRPGDPATNYTTAAKVNYTPSQLWNDTPWRIAARSNRSGETVSQSSRISDDRRMVGPAMDDILGIGASARYSKYAKIGGNAGGCKDSDGKSITADTSAEGILKDRYNRIGNGEEWKWAAEYFLTTTAINSNLKRLAEHDVWLPFNVVLLRPHMTYEMCSAVLMKGGMETGLTAVGHNDFQLGDDVAAKMHYGHYTFKSKAFVQQPRNIIIAENIFAQGYERGTNNVEFTDHHKMSIDENSNGSMHAWITSYQQQNFPSPMCLTGRFADDKASSGDHILGAAHYHEWWREHHGENQDPTAFTDPEHPFLENVMDRRNTVCYQGHQFTYSRQTKEHTMVQRNTGHWGPNVYPGCGVVRAGEAQHLRDMNYVDCAF